MANNKMKKGVLFMVSTSSLNRGRRFPRDENVIGVSPPVSLVLAVACRRGISIAIQQEQPPAVVQTSSLLDDSVVIAHGPGLTVVSYYEQSIAKILLDS